MKLSIIVPVYNAEKYIVRCLESLCDRTLEDYEVIVINDGSTDSSGVLAEEFSRKNPKVTVVSISNGGVSNARNLGISKARGEYIAFADSDDFVRPQMYEKMLATAEKYQVDVVSTDLVYDGRVLPSTQEPGAVYDEKRIRAELLPAFTADNEIGTMEFKNKIFRRGVIVENGIEFYTGFSFQEDLMFMINIYGNIKSFYYLPEAFYEYYPTPGGLYSSYRENAGRKFIEARRLMLALTEKYNININRKNFNDSFIYNISFFIYRTQNYVKDKQLANRLIDEVLSDETVGGCCADAAESSQSFDRRIARAVSEGKKKKAVRLINFVYSGKAEKLQNLYAKIKH